MEVQRKRAPDTRLSPVRWMQSIRLAMAREMSCPEYPPRLQICIPREFRRVSPVGNSPVNFPGNAFRVEFPWNSIGNSPGNATHRGFHGDFPGSWMRRRIISREIPPGVPHTTDAASKKSWRLGEGVMVVFFHFCPDNRAMVRSLLRLSAIFSVERSYRSAT